MAIYVGGTKCKLTVDNVAHKMHVYSFNPITNGIRLLSSDNYILADSKGIYITIKDNETYHVKLLSPDDCILGDANGVSVIAYDFSDSDMHMSTIDDYILQDTDNLYITTRKG